MKRRLFKSCAILSLLLCLATVTLWIRSHVRQDVAWIGMRGRVYEIAWINGMLRFNIANHAGKRYTVTRATLMTPPAGAIPTYTGYALEQPPAPPEFDGKHAWKSWPSGDESWHWYVQPLGNVLHRAGDAWIETGLRNAPGNDFSTEFNYPLWQVYLPFRYLAAITGLLPAIMVGAWAYTRYNRRARRERAGLCTQCGYDLRAHKSGDKCPECGTPIPTMNSATISGEPRRPP